LDFLYLDFPATSTGMTDGTDRDLFVLSTAINTFFIPPSLKNTATGEIAHLARHLVSSCLPSNY